MSQSDCRRKPQAGVVADLPGNCRRNIMGCVMQAEALRRAQPAVQPYPTAEVFRTKAAVLPGSQRGERPGGSQRIAQLETFVFRAIRRHNEALGTIPIVRRPCE